MVDTAATRTQCEAQPHEPPTACCARLCSLLSLRCPFLSQGECRRARLRKWSVRLPTSVARPSFRSFPRPFIHAPLSNLALPSTFLCQRLTRSFTPVVADKYYTTLKWPRAKLAQQMDHQPHLATLLSCRLHRCCQSDYMVVSEALWRAVFGLALTAVASTSHSTNFTPQVLRSAQRSGRNLRDGGDGEGTFFQRRSTQSAWHFNSIPARTDAHNARRLKATTDDVAPRTAAFGASPSALPV